MELNNPQSQFTQISAIILLFKVKLGEEREERQSDVLKECPVAQGGLKLAIQLSSQFFCTNFLSSRTIEVCHHTLSILR